MNFPYCKFYNYKNKILSYLLFFLWFIFIYSVSCFLFTVIILKHIDSLSYLKFILDSKVKVLMNRSALVNKDKVDS